jgi:hypothetical protein
MGLWDEFGDCPQTPPPPCAVWIDDISVFTERDWAALTTRIQEKRMKGLGIGRVVHYSRGDQCLAAIVTQVIDKEAVSLPAPSSSHSAMNITHCWNRSRNNSLSFATTNVHYSETKEMGTWHWPEYVE